MNVPKAFAGLLLMMAGIPRICNSQPPSYVYIQGDKETPFYVKLEGEMQPRYGKNYCILSQLAPGPIHLEVLFQQNVFPAQRFTVNVPEGGSRGFLLTKQQDSFALFDLQQGGYLISGNSEIDDKLPPVRVSAPAAAINPVAQEAPDNKSRKHHKPEHVEEQSPLADKIITPDTAAAEHFIEGISLDNSKVTAKTQTPAVQEHAADKSQEEIPANNPGIVSNTDCPAALSKEDFALVYRAELALKDDESRTTYVLNQLDKCYRCWQARALATLLSTDAARFTVLKKVYPRITDQAHFALLDDLLREASYKEAFNNLLHPKQ